MWVPEREHQYRIAVHAILSRKSHRLDFLFKPYNHKHVRVGVLRPDIRFKQTVKTKTLGRVGAHPPLRKIIEKIPK